MITKGYGFTVEDIDESCPADLEPYELAHRKEIEERDNMQYIWWGYYAMSAIGVSLEHCFSGKKAKSKYVEKTVLKEIEERDKPLTEEELKRQRELFVSKLEIMKSNFELNNEK